MARFDFIAAYMLANRKQGAIYTGSTSDLPTRLEQHRSGQGSKFTGTYEVYRLVWYQSFESMADAVHKERRLKTWKRQWKIDLIEQTNPHWDDLAGALPYT